MIYNIFTNWDNPKIAIIIYFIWVVLIIIGGIYFKIFPKEMLRIGAAKEGEKEIEFMGTKITTNKQVYLIMLYAFINQLISNYNTTIITPWRINTVQDPKSKVINMAKRELITLLNMDNIASWFNYILTVGMILSMELQFLLPKILASVIIENISTLKHIAGKTFL